MPQTIGTHQSTGVTLSSGMNPLTVTASGAIYYPAGTAIFGPGSQAWTVFNAGTVTGKTGISFAAGGYVSNASSATIAGTGGNGLQISGAAGSLTNNGVVTGAHWGVYLLTAGGSVSNTGTINGGAYAVVLGNGGTVSNAASGLITSSGYNNPEGIRIARAPGTVLNAGTISGTYHGIELDAGGSISNSGTILGGRGGIFLFASGTITNSGTISGHYDAVTMANGGTILNAAGGLIASTSGGDPEAIKDNAVPGYVQNAGTIFGTFDGVVLLAGGNVGNTGTISGVINDGIYLEGGGTVTNSGTISGGADAVQFVGNATDLLVIDPGAVFNGLVTGGSGANTIELGGSNAATLSGIGTQFTGFTQFAIDSGANWTLASTNTLAAGTAFTNAGTLTLEGPVTAGETIDFVNATGVLQLGDPTADAGVIDGFAAGDRIVLDGIADATTASVVNGNTVQVARSGNPPIDLTFNPSGTLSGAAFHVTELTGNATLTVSGITRTTGITLTSATNPLIIPAGASYTYPTGTEIFGPGTQAWTVFNAGLVSGLTGISFAAGGYVSDASTGTIIGTGTYGVIIAGAAGTVTNHGSISGSKIGVDLLTGTLANTGTIVETAARGYGVYLGDGGVISNAASGFIGGLYAVVAASAGSTVVNSGTVAGKSAGVYLVAGDVITNAAGGSITAPSSGIGLYASGAVTVVNDGRITGANAVNFHNGGTLINQSAGVLGIASIDLSVVIKGTGLVTNAGLIIGDVFWTGSGSVSNTGTIVSSQPVIEFSASGSVSNSGTIDGGIGGGILLAGGSVSNASGGVILASSGIRVSSNVGSVQNAGSILGSTDGVVLLAGGSVGNTGTIDGASNAGVYLKGGGTVSNSATMAGGVDAVQFVGNFTDRLIIAPGAVFQGKVAGGSGTNIVELGGTAGATLSGLGTQFTGFNQFAVDSGANWTLASSNTLAASTTFSNAGTLTLDGPVAAGETIAFTATTSVLQLGDPTADAGIIDGFVIGDEIVLDGVADATMATIVNANTVEVTRSGNPPIDLTFGTSLSGEKFAVTEQGGNAILTEALACFAQGTRIATPDGPRAVETLREGDLVHTVDGGVRPVRWIGFRRIDLTRHPFRRAAAPIRIAVDAFADGMPCRELRLSPDHAVLHRGMLIPIRLLCNETTIQREDTCPTVTYYHVELDQHDILLAEGLPVESYLDTGNRGIFENATTALVLHPRFDDAATGGQAMREAASCAPFVTGPARVEPVWRSLAHRAVLCGHQQPDEPEATSDPALCIATGPRVTWPAARAGGRYLFALPSWTEPVRLLSRSAVPSGARPWIEDSRPLGVMLSRLTIRQGGTVLPVPLDHPLLRHGWWGVERHGGLLRRWTTGAAELPLTVASPLVMRSPLTVEVEVAGTLDYPVPTQASAGWPDTGSYVAVTAA